MPFTPEALQAVVEILWHDLEHQTAFPGLVAREQEQAFQQGLQQIGAALLQRAWEAQDALMHARGVRCEVPDCPEQGWRMRRTARRSVHVLTPFGPVRYRRSEYQGRSGHRRQPVDERFGLQPGQPSPWLEGLLAELGAQQPFEQGAAWIWDLVRTCFPQAVEILDWPHAHPRLHTSSAHLPGIRAIREPRTPGPTPWIAATVCPCPSVVSILICAIHGSHPVGTHVL